MYSSIYELIKNSIWWKSCLVTKKYKAYLLKILTNTLHMAATLIGNALVLPWSWGTADGEILRFIDGDDAIITSEISDCAFEFENAEP